MFWKNNLKKGDIPITVLVIGVMAISALALLSFLSAGFNIGQSLVGVALMEEMNVKINEYAFYNNLGISEEKIKKELGIVEEGNRKYFYLEKNSPKFFPWREEEFLFSVQYFIP